MKILTVLAIVAAGLAIDARAGVAEAAPWCAWYDAYTSDCGYFTYQQCLNTIHGVGGWCEYNFYEYGWPNGAYGAPYAPAPRRHKQAKRRDTY